MIHRAPRLRTLGQDLVLVAMPAVALAASGGAAWTWLLAAAGLAVLAINALTLHFPHEVEVDAEGIHLRAYGREHAYAWRDVTVRVRRFVVRDRVYVRIEDRARGLRRGYWLLASLGDHDALLAAVEARAEVVPSAQAPRSTASSHASGASTS